MKLNIKRVKIGSSYYDVKYVNELKDEGSYMLGLFHTADKFIEIDNNCYQTKLQALLHECFHGIFWNYAIKDKENIVEPLSNGVYALIIDNPKFIQKILDYTKKLK